MISFFNKLGNSWAAKIICAALALSMMAFWGLGGLSDGFSADNKAISVDSTIITVNHLNQALDRERAKISGLTGQNLTVKKAIEIGLLDKTVQQLVAEQVSQKISDKIGLTASDEAVRKYVERHPAFQDAQGNFDANLFYTYLGQLRMNQAELSEELKKELANKHLSIALSKVATQNKTIIENIANIQKEKREISALLIKESDLSVGQPDNTTLKDYYEAYQEEFTAPEYRQIQLLYITPSDFKGEKETAYDRMYQAVQDLEDALGSGAPLKESAEKLGLPKPTLLITDFSGLNQNGKLADKTLDKNPLLQEVFTLSSGESTSIADYGNGFLVAEVDKVIPAALKPFENVKKDVIALWKAEEQKAKLPQTIQQTLTTLTEKGNWSKYKPFKEVVELTKAKQIPVELLSAIFDQSVGMKNAKSYPTNGGSWIIVVNKVIPNSEKISTSEKMDALAVYTQDLLSATQQSYAKDFDVKVNEKTIQKFFSAYMTEE